MKTGRYRLQLQLTAENALPIEASIDIHFDSTIGSVLIGRTETPHRKASSR